MEKNPLCSHNAYASVKKKEKPEKKWKMQKFSSMKSLSGQPAQWVEHLLLLLAVHTHQYFPLFLRTLKLTCPALRSQMVGYHGF